MNANDLRALNLSWENFQLFTQEYQTACKFCEWDRAALARDNAFANLEVNFDTFMAINKNAWLNHTSES